MDEGKGQGLSGRDVLDVWQVGRQDTALRRALALLSLWQYLLEEGRAEGRTTHYLLISAFSPAGVGKSSLLLRFADNTFSGESSLGAGVFWF
jgi:hypothetical protein